MPILRMAELTTAQLATLTRPGPTPALLLPVGAIEPHGPHGPLGTDIMIASRICETAARRASAFTRRPLVVLPALAYGVTEFGRAFPGAIGLRPDTMKRTVVDLCAAARDQRLGQVLVVSAHLEPEHLASLRGAIEDLEAQAPGTATLIDLTRRSLAVRLGEEFRSGSCHAGRFETSILLAERPSHVDEAARRDLTPLHVNMPEGLAGGADDFLALGMDDAYCGDPAAASAEEGRDLLEELARIVIEHVEDQ